MICGMASQPPGPDPRHVFISYVREDIHRVRRLTYDLKTQANGIDVWRDTEELWPGQDWKHKIRDAISKGSFAFLACFSTRSIQKPITYQNEELLLAVEQMRLRLPGTSWLIPIRFDDCPIPNFDLGAGRSLNDIQRVDLFGSVRRRNLDRLLREIQNISQTGLNRGIDSATPQRDSQPRSSKPNIRVQAGVAQGFTTAQSSGLGVSYGEEVTWVTKWHDVSRQYVAVQIECDPRTYRGNEYVKQNLEHFFNTCFELESWIESDESNGLTRGDIRKFVESDTALRIGRGIAQTTRHSKRLSQSAMTARIVSVHHDKSGVRAIVQWAEKGQSGTADALELAGSCIDAWVSFITGNGLQPPV
jgi:hypothetical protein